MNEDCLGCRGGSIHHTCGREPDARRRLRDCVERWPDAATGEYDPRCCRFPKSCSADVYAERHVTDDDLEPRP